jgi:hypothetical protein
MLALSFPARCCLIPMLALAVMCSLGLAQENEDQPKPKNLSREISKLKSQFSKRLSKLKKEYREAADDEEQESVVAARREMEVDITKQVLILTRQRDDDSRNIRDLVWYINRTKGDARENVYNELISKYGDSDRLTRLTKELGRASRPSEQNESWLRELIQKSSNERVQGDATFELANYLEQVRELAQYSDDEYLTSRTGEELDEEIESLLNQCKEEFADVAKGNSTIGRLATAKLFAAQIKVGKPAPEITGVDLDDVEFKLSDYRGKVVMIDFWGDW